MNWPAVVQSGRVQIVRVDFEHPDAQELVAAVQAEYLVRYGNHDETPMEPGALNPPSGEFYVGYGEDGRPIATGAWRWRPEVKFEGAAPAAEIKRMFVAGPGRGQGLGLLMLLHLEQAAAVAGARAMVLETGVAQPEAIALYEGSGYRPTEPFGYYAWSDQSRYYGKHLVESSGS